MEEQKMINMATIKIEPRDVQHGDDGSDLDFKIEQNWESKEEEDSILTDVIKYEEKEWILETDQDDDSTQRELKQEPHGDQVHNALDVEAWSADFKNRQCVIKEEDSINAELNYEDNKQQTETGQLDDSMKCDVKQELQQDKVQSLKLEAEYVDTCLELPSPSASLNIHKEIDVVHTLKKPYTCDVCSKSFSRSSNLSLHKLSHTKPCVCNICSMAFAQLSHLNRHKMMHTGEKLYVCKTCDKAFSEPSTLRKHSLIHTGEKPHTCNICSMSFSQGGNLKRHSLIHTGEKPHVCNVCNKAFARASGLERHTKRHTPALVEEDPPTYYTADRLASITNTKLEPQDMELDGDASDKDFKIEQNWESDDDADPIEAEVNTIASVTSVKVVSRDMELGGDAEQICESEEQAVNPEVNKLANINNTQLDPQGIGLDDNGSDMDFKIEQNWESDEDYPNNAEMKCEENKQQIISGHLKQETLLDQLDSSLNIAAVSGDVVQSNNTKLDKSPDLQHDGNGSDFVFEIGKNWESFKEEDSINAEIKYEDSKQETETEQLDDSMKCDVKQELQQDKVQSLELEAEYVDTCLELTSPSESLNRHKEIDAEEKTVCDVCNKSFNQPSDLFLHKLIHTGEKPFKCDSCSSSFTRSSNLRLHKLIHRKKKKVPTATLR